VAAPAGSAVNQLESACTQQLVQPQPGDDVDVLQIVGELGLRVVLLAAVEFEEDSFLGMHPHRDDERETEFLPVGRIEIGNLDHLGEGQRVEARACLLGHRRGSHRAGLGFLAGDGPIERC